MNELKKAFLLLAAIVCGITVLAGLGSALIGPARLDVVAIGGIGLAIYFARPERRREARRKLAAKIAGEEKSFKTSHAYMPIGMISQEILIKELDERLMNGKRAYPALYRYTEKEISREIDRRMHSV